MKKYRLYSEVREALCQRTVQRPEWCNLSTAQRRQRAEDAVKIVLGPDGPPWHIVETDDAPVTRIRAVFEHEGMLIIQTTIVPPDSQRYLTWDDDQDLVRYWADALGESPSAYPN